MTLRRGEMTNQMHSLQRSSFRLTNQRYSRPGTYLVTANTFQFDGLFGEIIKGRMRYNHLGMIVRQAWLDLPVRFAHVALDAFCVMPNQVHGMIILIGDLTVRERIKRPGLPEIMLAFKSISAQWINDFRKTPGLPIWQQNYHRRVVGSHAEVDRVREAIENQPLIWRMDVEQSFSILPIEAR